MPILATDAQRRLHMPNARYRTPAADSLHRLPTPTLATDAQRRPPATDAPADIRYRRHIKYRGTTVRE